MHAHTVEVSALASSYEELRGQRQKFTTAMSGQGDAQGAREGPGLAVSAATAVERNPLACHMSGFEQRGLPIVGQGPAATVSNVLGDNG